MGKPKSPLCGEPPGQVFAARGGYSYLVLVPPAGGAAPPPCSHRHRTGANGIQPASLRRLTRTTRLHIPAEKKSVPVDSISSRDIVLSCCLDPTKWLYNRPSTRDELEVRL